MKTDFETLKAMASYIINHLKEDSMVEFNMTKRIDLIEKMAAELSVSFVTDEDIKEQAIEEVEDKVGRDNVPDDITESEIYNHARKEIIKSYSGENISGLYLSESLHNVSKRMTKFLMDCELVEDVFGSDEEFITYFVQIIRGFNLRRG